jgi:hypothetical protein
MPKHNKQRAHFFTKGARIFLPSLKNEVSVQEVFARWQNHTSADTAKSF